MKNLHAALYLEAVLPALGLLATIDPELQATLAGPDFAVSLLTAGLAVRLAVNSGRLSVSHQPVFGDVKLWFPTASQLVRAFTHRPALVLPLGGWTRLLRAQRFLTRAGARLDALLNDRAAARNDRAFAHLHVISSFTIGIAGAACWLRRHPAAAAVRKRIGPHVLALATAEPSFSLWLDLAPEIPAWGTGEPPRPPVAAIRFNDLPTALSELGHRLDQSAAIGLRTLTVSGNLPLAEQLGLIFQSIDQLLLPPAAPALLPSTG